MPALVNPEALRTVQVLHTLSAVFSDLPAMYLMIQCFYLDIPRPAGRFGAGFVVVHTVLDLWSKVIFSFRIGNGLHTGVLLF